MGSGRQLMSYVEAISAKGKAIQGTMDFKGKERLMTDMDAQQLRFIYIIDSSGKINTLKSNRGLR